MNALVKKSITAFAPVLRFILSEDAYQNCRVFYYSLSKRRLAREVSADGYLEKYAEHINSRVPGLSKKITAELLATGSTDLDLLRKHGLKRHHYVFEHGVGYMRATAHFVRYLNKNCFVGNDISAERIELGKKNNSDLEKKSPTFYVARDNLFKLDSPMKFDFIYSSAVLCHMPVEDIKEAFLNIKHNLMHKKSKFIFNYSVLDFENFLYVDELGIEKVTRRVEAATSEDSGKVLFQLLKEAQGKDVLSFAGVNFFHKREFMEGLVGEAGLRFEDISEPFLEPTNNSFYYTRIIKAFL